MANLDWYRKELAKLHPYQENFALGLPQNRQILPDCCAVSG